MVRLRPYKRCDSKIIEKWIQDKDVFMRWGGERFGEFPISAEIIDEKYSLNNGDCAEEDNFYPWVALDDENRVVGHFIMRYCCDSDGLSWMIHAEEKAMGPECFKKACNMLLIYWVQIG